MNRIDIRDTEAEVEYGAIIAFFGEVATVNVFGSVTDYREIREFATYSEMLDQIKN